MSASDSNQYLVGSLLAFVIAVCFREHVGRIQNRHLFVSLVGAMALMLSSFLVKSILARITVPDDQLSAYWNTWIMPETFDSLMFCAISYHNSYRTAVLFWPDRQRYPLMIATAVVTVELALHIAAIIVIQINLLTYHTLIRDSLTQKLSLALIAYVSTVDSFFFALTQWRVISVMQDLHKARAPRLQYADAVLRGVCFSGAIFLYFASLSGLFFDPNEGLCFISISPAVLFIVLLTDSDRIRKLVLVLTGPQPAQPAYYDERSSGGAEYRMSTFVAGAREREREWPAERSGRTASGSL